MNAKEFSKKNYVSENNNYQPAQWVFDFAESFAKQKVLEYARQLTMTQFEREGPTKSVDHFFEND